MRTSEFNALRAEMRAMLAEQGYTKKILKELVTELLNKMVYEAVNQCMKEQKRMINCRITEEIKSNVNREIRNGVKQAVLEKLENSDYIGFGTGKKGGEQ